ncbi:hypothetical protein ISF6_5502 [Piscinibacter sakaiensis]|uniref:Uncharacterized protein n=1 Tax=Piscinibacter sakaiensis TaxID=1547922 RepID=A0A0K8P858_PISS1|nr:hypothetical protein ISF6_5502 [Piscinibacter sakaiensis]
MSAPPAGCRPGACGRIRRRRRAGCGPANVPSPRWVAAPGRPTVRPGSPDERRATRSGIRPGGGPARSRSCE